MTKTEQLKQYILDHPHGTRDEAIKHVWGEVTTKTKKRFAYRRYQIEAQGIDVSQYKIYGNANAPQKKRSMAAYVDSVAPPRLTT